METQNQFRKTFSWGRLVEYLPVLNLSLQYVPVREREMRRQDLIRCSDLQISGSQLRQCLADTHTLSLSLSVVVDAGNAAFIQQQLQRRDPLLVWGRDCWSYP